MNNLLRISLTAVGIALMLTAAVIGYLQYIEFFNEDLAQERVEDRFVLVAARNLDAGLVVSQTDIRWESIGEKQLSSAAIFRDKNSEVEVIGKRLQRALVAGEALTLNIVEPVAAPDSLLSILNKGFRAVTIPINDTDTASGLLRPNDRIDVVSLVAEGGGAPSIDIPFIDIGTGGKTRGAALLRNVRVLAIGGKLKEAGSGSLTLELSPADAIRLLAADKEGDLGVMIRRPDDPAEQLIAGRKSSEGAQAETKPLVSGEELLDATTPPKLVISRGKMKNPRVGAAMPSPLSALTGVR